MENEIYPVRLRLELKDSFLSNKQRRMMKRYGESASGNTIVREVLIPSDMPLRSLHFMIQKAFGWQHSHLHKFSLQEKYFRKLTGGKLKEWFELTGTVFQPPTETGEEFYYTPNFRGGGFNAWLKRLYTGPYPEVAYEDAIEESRQEFQDFIDVSQEFQVRESFQEYMNRKETDEDAKPRILRTAPLIDLTIDEMNASMDIGIGANTLLESVEVDKILASRGEKISKKDVFPCTHELHYNYDFGDGWNVTITKFRDCKDLIKNNNIDETERKEAERLVIEKHKPVCIHKEGLNVMDDVGGLSGYADFIGYIYEGEDKNAITEMKLWAKSIGWRSTKASIHSVL